MADVETEWDSFARQYKSDRVYWYFPQGKQVNSADLGDIFNVFAEFDAREWNGDAVFARLREEGLTSGGPALPRQQLRVFENLGLAWRDAENMLRVTPAGAAFAEPTGRQAILERHLWRFQLTNPFNTRSAGVRLFPHVFLLKVLLFVGGAISQEEFKIFVERAKRPGDRATVVENINRWRALSEPQRDALRKKLRSPIFTTISNNVSYAAGLHRCATYIQPEFRDEHGHLGLALARGRRRELIDRIKEHDRDSVWIDFAGQKENCIAFYGDVEREPTLLDALETYLDRGDIPRAIVTYRKLPRALQTSGRPEEFEQTLFLEKDLEDFLESRLNLIEAGLVREGRGRQHPTTIGTIDLFARAANGDLVVIELKKGRASDKVFGQLCRYMGYVSREYHGGGNNVRGYIIGSEIDLKLTYAAWAVPDGLVSLKRYVRDTSATPPIWIESGR
ncbi:MAG TPA: endonuclease NucS domain-containing protein [Fimbriimonadaceae bacterium]|nr:endonuclease NucS domain-containing protein [Fimbriimonadaceae bacterium]